MTEGRATTVAEKLAKLADNSYWIDLTATSTLLRYENDPEAGTMYVEPGKFYYDSRGLFKYLGVAANVSSIDPFSGDWEAVVVRDTGGGGAGSEGSIIEGFKPLYRTIGGTPVETRQPVKKGVFYLALGGLFERTDADGEATYGDMVSGQGFKQHIEALTVLSKAADAYVMSGGYYPLNIYTLNTDPIVSPGYNPATPAAYKTLTEADRTYNGGGFQLDEVSAYNPKDPSRVGLPLYLYVAALDLFISQRQYGYPNDELYEALYNAEGQYDPTKTSFYFYNPNDIRVPESYRFILKGNSYTLGELDATKVHLRGKSAEFDSLKVGGVAITGNSTGGSNNTTLTRMSRADFLSLAKAPGLTVGDFYEVVDADDVSTGADPNTIEKFYSESFIVQATGPRTIESLVTYVYKERISGGPTSTTREIWTAELNPIRLYDSATGTFVDSDEVSLTAGSLRDHLGLDSLDKVLIVGFLHPYGHTITATLKTDVALTLIQDTPNTPYALSSNAPNLGYLVQIKYDSAEQRFVGVDVQDGNGTVLPGLVPFIVGQGSTSPTGGSGPEPTPDTTPAPARDVYVDDWNAVQTLAYANELVPGCTYHFVYYGEYFDGQNVIAGQLVLDKYALTEEQIRRFRRTAYPAEYMSVRAVNTNTLETQLVSDAWGEQLPYTNDGGVFVSSQYAGYGYTPELVDQQPGYTLITLERDNWYGELPYESVFDPVGNKYKLILYNATATKELPYTVVDQAANLIRIELQALTFTGDDLTDFYYDIAVPGFTVAPRILARNNLQRNIAINYDWRFVSWPRVEMNYPGLYGPSTGYGLEPTTPLPYGYALTGKTKRQTTFGRGYDPAEISITLADNRFLYTNSVTLENMLYPDYGASGLTLRVARGHNHIGVAGGTTITKAENLICLPGAGFSSCRFDSVVGLTVHGQAYNVYANVPIINSILEQQRGLTILGVVENSTIGYLENSTIVGGFLNTHADYARNTVFVGRLINQDLRGINYSNATLLAGELRLTGVQERNGRPMGMVLAEANFDTAVVTNSQPLPIQALYGCPPEFVVRAADNDTVQFKVGLAANAYTDQLVGDVEEVITLNAQRGHYLKFRRVYMAMAGPDGVPSSVVIQCYRIAERFTS
ncbi:hypothetical protein [Hymenobacter glacieicola]|nr:hypothetical protein [Hymenobacter glacieicola]